jgi:AraC-like DNA-binding protein
MRYLNLKLSNTKFMMTLFEPNSSDPIEHDHGNDYQITVPLSGNSFLEQNKSINNMDKNNRIITPPGEKHFHFTEQNESRLLLINIDKDFLTKVVSSKLNRQIHDIDFRIHGRGSSEKLVKIADETIRTNLFGDGKAARTEELEWELAEILLSIQDGSHSGQWQREVSMNHPLIKKVVMYICENYQNELSLDHLATESNLSKFYLIRIFKEVMGCTPSQYLLNIRLERAVEQLIFTDFDITRICFDVGFGSLNTFERVFKKRYGKTISEFRKSNKV